MHTHANTKVTAWETVSRGLSRSGKSGITKYTPIPAAEGQYILSDEMKVDPTTTPGLQRSELEQQRRVSFRNTPCGY